MCRHLAYLGDPVTIGQLVVQPPYGLYHQSWAPRMQKYGTVNADGFGVGWYADTDPLPARYRRDVPIWADPSFADLSRVVHTRALLAAVRSATDGCASGEAAGAPYTAGRWLFSHNGALPGWPAGSADIAAALPPGDLLELEAHCDSALVWALVLRRLRDGATAAEALTCAVTDIAVRTEARLNLLLTDGTQIAATTWGDTLHRRLEPGRCVLVASEPGDDHPGWAPVPDGSLLVATPDAVTVTPLADPPG
jgi:glutamine amidotransferase